MFQTAEPVNVPEVHCQNLLAQWFERADMRPDFPLSTGLVVDLLRDGGEYLIDAEGFAALQAMGQAPNIAEWDARDIMAAAGALEGRRQWKLTPSIHDPKKTTTRIALEQHMQTILDVHKQRAALLEAEQRELAEFMTPAQRVKFMAVQEQIRRNLEQMRQRRMP